MILFEDWVYPLLIFILGGCFGSFAGVIIARLPEGKSIVRPRSFCFSCKTPIKIYDNIPFISWIVLRGKCRKCGKSFGFRNLLLEVLSGVIFLSLYIKFGFNYYFIEALILSWGMLVVSFIDLDHRIIPDVFTLTGMALGLLGGFLNPERTFLDALWGFLAGGGFLWGVAYVYSAIKNEEGMGGGDIKLLAWIGSVMGWKAVIYTILMSSIVGSVVGLAQAARQKSGLKTTIPFGPFLSLAAFSYFFVGAILIQKYLQFFFPFISN